MRIPHGTRKADVPAAQERPPEDTTHRKILCGLDRKLFDG